MVSSIIFGLLTVTLLHAPIGAADEAIHFSTNDGRKHTELKLNGNMECILENERIGCVPTSR